MCDFAVCLRQIVRVAVELPTKITKRVSSGGEGGLLAREGLPPATKAMGKPNTATKQSNCLQISSNFQIAPKLSERIDNGW